MEKIASSEVMTLLHCGPQGVAVALSVELEKKTPLHWPCCLVGEELKCADALQADTPDVLTKNMEATTASAAEVPASTTISFTDKAVERSAARQGESAQTGPSASEQVDDGGGLSHCAACMASTVIVGILGAAFQRWERTRL